MKHISWFVLAAVLLAVAGSAAFAQTDGKTSSAVLYSPNKYPKERKGFCLNFRRGVAPIREANCDLRYGYLYAGDELDWFETAVSGASRNVIEDLGMHDWGDEFTVPVVAPLPELRPGEKRQVMVDVSGKDGEDGEPGAAGVDGADGADAANTGGAFSGQPSSFGREPTNNFRDKPAVSKPKNDGKPKVSAPFIKAVAGHIYVIHVVNDSADFYALFRVDSLERGDSCSLTWMFTSPPVK
ncbi:MAG TPA: hypothetical protein VE961_09830 [Pyrinomonadaceae bacterium]|nr:hypothetical protein [Pyrinomonadaceae bacterium]